MSREFVTRRVEAAYRDNHFVITLISFWGPRSSGSESPSFRRHGISNTVARPYFELPDPGPDHIFLEDGRIWVFRGKADGETGTTVDIIVHGCFPDDSVPSEFWKNLKPTMHPEGIVVVEWILRVFALRAFWTMSCFPLQSLHVSEGTFENEFINGTLSIPNTIKADVNPQESSRFPLARYPRLPSISVNSRRLRLFGFTHVTTRILVSGGSLQAAQGDITGHVSSRRDYSTILTNHFALI
ncbi:hypothetical protein BD779DRAFT_1475667 [Infundibulicybe gibba]|nr:hypothetical protein BD779DRAFT_1475667 [Infundibulicybe gibba]